MFLRPRKSFNHRFRRFALLCGALACAAFVLHAFLKDLKAERPNLPAPPKHGEIRGHVEIKTILKEVTRQRGQRYRARGKPEGTRRENQASTEPEVTNVVVYLEEVGRGSSYTPPARPATLIQRDTRFEPYVLPILVGTRVQIVNKDDFYHNVFSNSDVKRFNIGRQLTNAMVTETFDKPGFIPVFCDIHLEMSAFVLVLENPYFTKPDAGGNFLIENVPLGRYRVLTWHERLLSQVQEVTVQENGSVTVDFTL